VRAFRHQAGDILTVNGCAGPDLAGPKPCASGSLEAFSFIRPDRARARLEDGDISVIAGVRTWVARCASSRGTGQFHAFFELNGQIYAATLSRDGAPFQPSYYQGQTNEAFHIYFNGPALETIRSSFHF
jgi:hypothetical protein